jgi:DNA-binding MarR family transcriptional regulator
VEDRPTYLIVPLLQGFEWFDEGLQRGLRARGWPILTRPESMIMHHVIQGIVRPSDIARSLGLTRQAVHTTIAQIVDKGVFELVPDPEDKRIRAVALTQTGKAMRADARLIVTYLSEQLGQRIGQRRLANLLEGFSQDWGAPPDYPWPHPEEEAAARPSPSAGDKPVKSRARAGTKKVRATSS